MMKRLFCVLLSLVMMAAAVAAFAEDAETAEAAETVETAEVAEPETQEPELLVTVNGAEILSDNDYLQGMIEQITSDAAQNGYDTSSPDIIRQIRQLALRYTIQSTLIRQKAAELGIDQMTDAEKADAEAAAVAEWEEIIEYYTSQSGVLTDESTEDDKAAARADTEAQLLSTYGYDRDRYVTEYMDYIAGNVAYNHIRSYVSEGLAVTDEDVQAYFNDLVEDDKETYEGNADYYEFVTNYYGQSSYYRPEGYRGIIHILLKPDDELMNTWKDLSARLEEQKSGAGAESTETESLVEDEEATPEDAEATPAPEAEPTPEPVTEEMVAAAEQAILDSVQATVDEINAKLEAGASFTDLVKEYGQDNSMKDDALLAGGYPVHKDSIIYDAAFTAAAAALEKVGDISEPFVGQYGVHIVQYLRDIPGGAVELTDAMKEEFRATLLSEMQDDALVSALDKWESESEIVYTEAGEAWKLTEEEAEAEEPAAEEAAETEEAATAEAAEAAE